MRVKAGSILRENQKVVSLRRDRISGVREINLAADELVSALLRISERECVCILDSSGARHLGSHLLIAGVRPVEVIEVSNPSANDTLEIIDTKLSGDLAAIFTLSYPFGLKLQGIPTSHASDEPDLFISLFDVLAIHDYDRQQTFLIGSDDRFDEIAALISDNVNGQGVPSFHGTADFDSNFTRSEYMDAVERIRERIRAGDTYQTNLTQQLRCLLPANVTPQKIFDRLRRDHPAPFAAFLIRDSSVVVSASPERFFRIDRDDLIEAAPIKGTRPRGRTPREDERFRSELEASEKDRAENTMIVDLLRNDLGRVCEFGSVVVDRLCEIEEHPSLFHLVSTILGKVRSGTKFSELLAAVFPCGSITGAPKIRTMQIIDQIETADRGLSMGAIGCFVPRTWPDAGDVHVDVSVAIRTMVIRNNQVVFNVGGGVVIDSDPAREYDESLLKAKALLSAIGSAKLRREP